MDKKDFIIAVDLDDCMEDLLTPWLAYLNAKHNLSVEYEDIKDWDMQKAFPTLTKAQIYEPLLKPDFYKNVKPKDNSVEVLKKLYDDGFNIYVCTSTFPSLAECKIDYLISTYFPFIDWKHIIICSNKQLIKANILIDDCFTNIDGGSYLGLLYDAPYNQIIPNSTTSIKRVRSWDEIYLMIHTYYDYIYQN